MHARLAVAAILIVVALVVVAPHLLPGCGFHRLTGLHCPGCGSTRALGHLLRGEVGTAVLSNPLLVLGLPLLSVGWLRRAWRASATGRPPEPVPRRAIYGAAGLVLLFWILRNVPLYPFTLFAP